MISYIEWKKQLRIAEATANIDQEIERLIQTTASDISDDVQAYVDKMGGSRTPERLSPQPPQSQPSPPPSPPTATAYTPGAFEKFGRGIDDTGRAIGRGAAAAARAAGPSDDTFERMKKRPDIFNRAGSALFTPQSGEENLPWHKRLLGRLGHAAKRFVGYQRESINLESIFPPSELKNILAEHGIKRFFLVEANADFSSLSRSIVTHLKAFADSLKRVSSTPEAAPEAGTEARPVSGGTVDVAEPTPNAAPAEKVPQKDPLTAAKEALSRRSRGTHLAAYMKRVGAQPGDENKVVRALLKELGFSKGVVKVAAGIVNSGMFPDEVIQAIKTAGHREEQSEVPPEAPAKKKRSRKRS